MPSAVNAAGGHSKSALSTVYQKHRTLRTRKWMYRVRRLPGVGRLRKRVSLTAKLATEAPINGGRNYDGPKVEFSALRYGDISISTLLYAGTSEYPTVLAFQSGYQI